jgi:hypothetical protein
MRKGIFFLAPMMVMLIVVFLILMILPIIAWQFFPIIEILLKAYFCLIIFMFVRNILGGGVLSYAIAAVLIYVFIIKLGTLFTMGYMIYMLMGFGLTGILMFIMPRQYPKVPFRGR